MRLSLVVVLLLAGFLPLPGVQGQEVPVPESVAPASTLKIDAEYLVWWIREGHVPPLLTTSSPASQGLLDKPDTRVVFGDRRLETRHKDRFVGARVGLDWMDGSQEFGFEGRAFFLERDSTYRKVYNGDGSRLLALSYVDGTTGQQASRILSGPDPQRGLLAGGFVGYSRIEWFGEEANFVIPVAHDESWQVDLLAGARFLQMRDRFHQTGTSRILPDQAILYGVTDNYRIANAFYGAQLGARGEAHYGRFTFEMRGTVALGADAERIRTFGETIFHTPAARIATPVGLLIGPNNTGDHHRTVLDGAGEVGFTVAYQLTRCIRVQAGYTFLAWFDPLRAGDQVDRVANRSRLPFEGETLWVQGVSMGLETRW